MRRALIALVVVSAAALAAAPLGIAGSGSVSDPRDDLWAQPTSGGSASLDMVRATFGHAGNGRLVHTVTLAGAAANPAGGGNVPTLLIEDPARPNGGTSLCRYFVGVHKGRLGVFTCGYADRVASARISRTSSNTIRYEFSARAIDNPATYDWAFVTRGTVFGTQGDLDRLPDGDHSFLTHRLR
jgi:hypothetical protein